MGERVSGEKIKRCFKFSIGNKIFLIIGKIPKGKSLNEIVAIVMETIKGVKKIKGPIEVYVSDEEPVTHTIKGEEGVGKDDGKSQPIQIVIQDLVIQIMIDLGLGDVIHDGEKGKAIQTRIGEVVKQIDTEGGLEGILDKGKQGGKDNSDLEGLVKRIITESGIKDLVDNGEGAKDLEHIIQTRAKDLEEQTKNASEHETTQEDIEILIRKIIILGGYDNVLDKEDLEKLGKGELQKAELEKIIKQVITKGGYDKLLKDNELEKLGQGNVSQKEIEDLVNKILAKENLVKGLQKGKGNTQNVNKGKDEGIGKYKEPEKYKGQGNNRNKKEDDEEDKDKYPIFLGKLDDKTKIGLGIGAAVLLLTGTSFLRSTDKEKHVQTSDKAKVVEVSDIMSLDISDFQSYLIGSVIDNPGILIHDMRDAALGERNITKDNVERYLNENSYADRVAEEEKIVEITSAFEVRQQAIGQAMLVLNDSEATEKEKEEAIKTIVESKIAQLELYAENEELYEEYASQARESYNVNGGDDRTRYEVTMNYTDIKKYGLNMENLERDIESINELLDYDVRNLFENPVPKEGSVKGNYIFEFEVFGQNIRLIKTGEDYYYKVDYSKDYTVEEGHQVNEGEVYLTAKEIAEVYTTKFGLFAIPDLLEKIFTLDGNEIQEIIVDDKDKNKEEEDAQEAKRKELEGLVEDNDLDIV